jgi:flagellar motor switch protein FliN
MEENKVENNMERLMDVEMNVTVRFGRTEMPLREVVRFGVGSMIELNRSVDEPVELLVNNSPFARGEVVVVDGYYGVRVTEIGSAEERTMTLMSESENTEAI